MYFYVVFLMIGLGYGDSSGSIFNERHCVIDSLTVYKYVCHEFPNSPIFFWGHSLGTG